MAKPTSASSHVDQEEEISKVEPVLINRRNKKNNNGVGRRNREKGTQFNAA